MTESLLGRLCDRVVAVVDRAPRWVSAVGGLLAAVSIVLFLTRLEYRTQRGDLISPDKDCQRRMREYTAEFGHDDDLVFVVRGDDRSAQIAAIEALAEKLRERSDMFDRLFYKIELGHLRDRSLLYLSSEQIRSLQENIHRMGPLLIGPAGPSAWKGVTLFALLRQARERAGRFDPTRPLDPADEQFLAQLEATVRAATAALHDPADYRNPWGSLVPGGREFPVEPQYFFSPDGSLLTLTARPVQETGSFTPTLKSVAAARELLDHLRPLHPDVRFGLTGLPVLETDEMAASQRDSVLAGWIALIGVGLLYAFEFRCLRSPAWTVGTLLIGTAWAMGWLTLTVGHLNILSMTFAVMLIGIGDYGVLWVTHYEQRREQGDGVKSALHATARQVGPGILTAAGTTAMAFFAAAFADFRAVAELGWIAGCGVLLCALATFTVLPAMITLTDRRGPVGTGLGVIAADGTRAAVPRPQRPVAEWLPILTRRPRTVLAVGAVLLTASGLLARYVGYDHNLLHLQADGLDSVSWERELMSRNAGACWSAVSVAASPEEARDLRARYERRPEFGRVVEVASLVPDDQPRKLEQLEDVQRWLRGLPPMDRPIEPLTVRGRQLRQEVQYLIGALGPQAPVCPRPVLEQLLRVLAELRDHPALDDAADPERLKAFERSMVADLLADLHRLKAVSVARPIRTDDIPLPLRERYVGASGSWLVQAYAKADLWELEPLERFTRAARAVDAEATGRTFGTLEGLMAMRNGFIRAGLCSLAVIVAVLLLDLRSLKLTLLALFPLAAGAVMLLGIMGALNWPFNPANMIALPLIVGVGVDNGVHVLHDYLNRDRRRTYVLSRSTGQGVAVAAMTTVLGFGALAISEHKGLSGLGVLLAVGVTCCMTAALGGLPALLRWGGECEVTRPAARAA